MIEFNQTLDDLNNSTVWEITFNSNKIGTLRKEHIHKIKGVQHGGKYYLSVLYRDYVLPFKVKSIIPKLVQGAVNSFEADAIMIRVSKSDWEKNRVKYANQYKTKIEL